MSSFTSSSKNEWKVIVVVVAAIAACEVGVRVQARKYANERHLKDIPRIAADLSSQPSPRVLFLGNSLTREGIRTDVFADELARHGLRAGGMAKVHPDGSVISQWYYLFDGHFAREATAHPPDCVVVTFVNEHLSDQASSRQRNTAIVVDGFRQIIDVLRYNTSSLDEGADFLAAHVFTSVAKQEVVKDRALAAIVPCYKVMKQRLNHLRRARAAESQTASGQPTVYTYARLRRFMDELKASDTHGVFCEMPIPGRPILDDRLVTEVERASMTIIDLRSLISKTQGHYPDNYHMDPVAAEIYSRAVADALADQFPGMFDRIETP